MTGIYCIENTINGKKYVGQALDIYARWRHHKCLLKNNKHHSPVIWIETGEEFKSISEAAKNTGYSIDGISRVCRGCRKTIHKQHFKFITGGST